MKSQKAVQNQAKAEPSRSRTRAGVLFFSLLLCFSLVLSYFTIPGKAAPDSNPAPVQLYYVTLPETDGLAALQAISAGNTRGVSSSPMYTYFSIAVGVTSTYVYYDQWEDGYAADIANPTVAEIFSATNPGGVQIWGNGIAADGCAPNINGVPYVGGCTDANDVLHAGEVIIPYNPISIPRVAVAQNYVLDEFGTAAYNNNNGNTNWSTTWVEANDDGSATAGSILITSGALRFQSTTGTETGDSIYRGVDLSTGGSCASLSFTLGQSLIDASEDRLQLEISSDGGLSYTIRDTYTSSAAAGAKAYAIPEYATASTRIRFVLLDELETSEYWTIDSARVDWNCSLPILFDGRDKVGASSSIAMARATWASTSTTLNAFAHEMYATAEWGTTYESPVGTNTANAGTMFEYSALSIMASQNNTTVQIDANADGTYETTVPLQEGGATLVSGIRQGAKVLSDKPVQVLLVTGDIGNPPGSGYASRDINLLPTAAWGSSYWSPVGVVNSTYNTRLFLYNLSTNGSIYITCERYGVVNTTLGPVVARGVTTIDLTNGQGAHCFASTSDGTPTSDLIFAVGTIDTNYSYYDWSFTLYPDTFLSTDALVGLGLGKDPTDNTSTENGSPLWVTAACSTGGTYVYVDWNNDGVADGVDSNGDDAAEIGSENGILVTRLQSVRLFEPGADTEPYDQSGARVWSRTASNMGVYNDPAGVPGCVLALAWGEDPANASAASPGLDVGTSVSPLRLIEGTKSLMVVNDTAPVGVLNPGDTVYYNITVKNAGTVIVNNVRVYDVVPAHTTYVAGSTEWGTTSSYGTPIADAPAPGDLPLSQAGGVLLGNLDAGQTFYVRFKVTLLPGDYEDITNCDTAYTQAGNFTRCVTNPVATRDWGDLPSSYGTTAAANGPRHSASSLKLGALWDVETQGQPSANANGDDLATSDDEDGVATNPNQQWAPSNTVNLYVTVAGGPGVLGGWFDWNNDGDVADAGEFVNFGSLPTGVNTVSLSIPSVYRGGTPVYARFRLSSSGGFPGGSLDASDYLGYAVGGEVEDYYWTFFYRDWGDLPNTYGTDSSSNGPRHSGGTLILGAYFDAELNGQPSAYADGDDLAGTTPDDEDGIALTVLNADTDTVQITATCKETGDDGKGWLIVWFDWDHSGSFNASEATFNQQITCDSTPQTLTSTSYTYPQMYYLSYRARLFNVTSSPGTLAFVGEYTNGEVEDYYMQPTAATVSQVAAAPLEAAIRVDWQTFSEVNILGFRLRRAASEDGLRTVVYETQAQYPGSVLGAAYGFEDQDVQPGEVYYYWLEVLLKDGSSIFMDPVSSGLFTNRFYLPVIQR